ncbi:hypothetical protein [Streptomyces parvus]|uniref:hypothetical protein n=1 Tax=Streptomyces parvus TaxID=66428 RepID=UPI00344F62BB
MSRPVPGTSWVPPPSPGLQAHAERTRSDADRYAAVLEDIATNGPPPVEDCTPREELREAQLARLAAQRPAVA